MPSTIDTSVYMIAGLTVIFSILLLYTVSLWLRWRKLKAQEKDWLQK